MTGCGRNSVVLDSMTVEAIMCSLNEEDYIFDSLESALHQCLIDDNPGKVKVILADSGSTDGTLSIAETFKGVAGFEIKDVPKGKLNARDTATRASVADLIISLDSDTIYPYGFYARLIKHFADPKVTAVGGYMHMDNPFAKFTADAAALGNTLGMCHRMLGGACAFRRDAYVKTGGFNLTVDQKNIYAMVPEEEFLFGERLAGVGKYVFEPKALAHSSSRRFDLDPKFLGRQLRKETF